MKPNKTMLDILNERLVEGLSIKSIKETNNKYKICFEYEGEEVKAELPKSCTPGCHNEVADNAIITAMSTIYLNRGDMNSAKIWLDKLAAVQ